MALYKKAEFARICGVSNAYLTVNINRKKVVMQDDGMIDGNLDYNIAFMEKCKSKKPDAAGMPKEIIDAPGKSDKPRKKASSPEPEPENEETKTKNTKFEQKFDLDLEKQKMAIQKLERESRLAEIQHQRQIGKLMPKDAVETIFIQTIKGYTMAFKQAADKIAVDFGTKNKLSRNDMAELRATIVSAINRAAEDATAEGIRSVDNVVKEYMTKVEA